MASFCARVQVRCSFAHLASYIDSAAMREQSFRIGERGNNGRKALQPFARKLLHAGATDEVPCGKPTTGTRSSARGQNVVRTAGVIANALRGPWTEKNAARRKCL